MLDSLNAQFLNHLIKIKTTQFSQELTKASPATIMAMTHDFQVQMKQLVEDKQIPQIYSTLSNLISQGAILLDDSKEITNKIKRRITEIDHKLQIKDVDLYFARLDAMKKSLLNAVEFDPNNLQAITTDLQIKIRQYDEIRKIIISALADFGKGPSGPTPFMNVRPVVDIAAIAARENAQREEERKRKEAQEQLQRDIENAARLAKEKQDKEVALRKEAQEKAKREEEQRQRLQQQQASLAQDAAKARAEFEAKRQSLLDMQQKQLAQQGTPILTMSKRALPVLPEVKQKVDEMLETIKNRKPGQWITLKRPNEQIYMSPALDFFEAADKLFLSQAKEIKTLEQFDRVMNEHHNKMWEVYDLDKAHREQLHLEWMRREEILAAQQREAVRQQQMLEQAQPQRQRAYAYR